MRGRPEEHSNVGSLRRKVPGILWAAASRIALAVGIGCATLRWGLATTLLLACMFTLIAGSVACNVWGPGRGGFRPAVRCGMVVGLAATALVGAVAALGVPGCLLAPLLLGTRPAVNAMVWSHWRRRFGTPDLGGAHLGADPSAGLEAIDPPWRPAALDLLDDAALCRTWRQSFVHMAAATSLERRLTLIEHRRLCLDELQRRDPDGFAAWLASGARAASNPLPFLRKALPPSD